MSKDAIEQLIPHRRTMLLLDRLLSVSATSARTEVDIHEDHVFAERGAGVPAWVGLEFMGQTAALIGGYAAAEQTTGDAGMRMGYLAGVRKFSAHTDYFEQGTLLVESVEQAVLGESLAKYSCKILTTGDGALLAEAVLTVVRKLSPQ